MKTINFVRSLILPSALCLGLGMDAMGDNDGTSGEPREELNANRPIPLRMAADLVETIEEQAAAFNAQQQVIDALNQRISTFQSSLDLAQLTIDKLKVLLEESNTVNNGLIEELKGLRNTREQDIKQFETILTQIMQQLAEQGRPLNLELPN